MNNVYTYRHRLGRGMGALLAAMLLLAGCDWFEETPEIRPRVTLFEPQICTSSGGQAEPFSGDLFARVAAPQTPKPASGVVINEAVYGTCLMRLTNAAAEPPAGFVRSDYARRQAFNADGSRMIVVAEDGAWHLYDPRVPEYITQLPGFRGAAEPHWDPLNPNLISFLPEAGLQLQVHELNIQTQQAAVAGDLGQRILALWPTAVQMGTGAEGSPSADGRYWAFQISDSTAQGLGIVVWDKQSDTLVSSLAIDALPDHVSMSPGGRHVVVSWAFRTALYTPQLTYVRDLLDSSEHSDLAIGSDGEDYYVSIDYASEEGDIFMVNLNTGVRTALLSTYIARKSTTVHVSGKAYGAPGWVVVSTYDDSGDDPEWFYQRIWLMQMTADPVVYPLAFHQSRIAPGGGEDNYWAEPQATINRAGDRLIFNSNWNSSDVRDVDVYSIDIPLIESVAARRWDNDVSTASR